MIHQHIIQLIFLILFAMVYAKPFGNHEVAYIVKYDANLDELYEPYYNVQASDDKEFVMAIKSKFFGTGDDGKTHQVIYKEANEDGIRPNVEQVESKPPALVYPQDFMFAAHPNPNPIPKPIPPNCVASLCGGGLG